MVSDPPPSTNQRQLTKSRASELLNSIPREDRSMPHLPFSPPPQQAFHLPTSPAEGGVGPRPSIGEFMPSPGPGAFDADSSMIAGPSRLRGSYGYETDIEEDVLEEDEFQLARSYFDTKEFERVVYTLKHARGKRAVFLRTYSAYLVSSQSLFANIDRLSCRRQIGGHKRHYPISWIRKKNDLPSTRPSIRSFSD